MIISVSTSVFVLVETPAVVISAVQIYNEIESKITFGDRSDFDKFTKHFYVAEKYLQFNIVFSLILSSSTVSSSVVVSIKQ
jgi:hypothetical protein